MLSSFKKIKYLSSILALSSSLSHASANPVYAKLTIVNNSGSEMSADILSSAGGACINTTYDFVNKRWIGGFYDNRTTNILDIPKDSTQTVFIETSCLRGGTRMNIAKGSRDLNFLPGMGMSNRPGEPDLNTYKNTYQIFEMGWPDNGTGTAVWNTSVVDFFALALQLKDSKGNEVGFVNTDKDGSPVSSKKVRNILLDAYSKNSMYTGKTILGPDGYRIFAPSKIYQPSPVSSTAWDNQIDNDLNILVSKSQGIIYTYGGYRYKELSKGSNEKNMLHAVCSENSGQSWSNCTLTEINTQHVIPGIVPFTPGN
ncbi:MAG TPA: hypothetical protein VKR58_03030, partial [Aquella sp.]|nr:hypothetical protein [Aquella sp.]